MRVHYCLHMKKLSLYIETSVVSYLTGRPSSNTIVAGHQAATQELWSCLLGRFAPHISDLLLQEIQRGDPSQAEARLDAIRGLPILDVDQEVERVAGALLARKAVPRKCPEDAVHVAVAAVNHMELIVTWNFRHINNPVMKGRMRDVLAQVGYDLPEICSPDELLEVDDA